MMNSPQRNVIQHSEINVYAKGHRLTCMLSGKCWTYVFLVGFTSASSLSSISIFGVHMGTVSLDLDV